MQGTPVSTSRPRVTSPDWVNEVWPLAAPPAPTPPATERLVEPRVHPHLELVELPADPPECGNGRWCRECRDEIRKEALRWIRELNAGPVSDRPRTTEPGWYRTWHAELMLGDT